MSTPALRAPRPAPGPGADKPVSAAPSVGPIGRLGAWTATHFRVVALAWVVIVVGLGFFAPKVEKALSGAGWEASGSESVEARDEAGGGPRTLSGLFHGRGARGVALDVR